MSADAISMGVYPIHNSTFNNIERRLHEIQHVLHAHGEHQVAAVVHNEIISSMVDDLRAMISNSSEPQFKKDEYLEFLNDSLAATTHPVSAEAEEAVRSSPLGEAASAATASPGFRYGDEDGAVSTSQQDTDGPEKSFKGKGSNTNWLLILAERLANIQDKFLGIALEALDVMEANADAMTEVNPTEHTSTQPDSVERDGNTLPANENNNAESDASRGEFLVAQAKYQASMQMFNMMANMTATSIKSLGEGLTAIARKQ